MKYISATDIQSLAASPAIPAFDIDPWSSLVVDVLESRKHKIVETRDIAIGRIAMRQIIIDSGVKPFDYNKLRISIIICDLGAGVSFEWHHDFKNMVQLVDLQNPSYDPSDAVRIIVRRVAILKFILKTTRPFYPFLRGVSEMLHYLCDRVLESYLYITDKNFRRHTRNLKKASRAHKKRILTGK